MHVAGLSITPAGSTAPVFGLIAGGMHRARATNDAVAQAPARRTRGNRADVFVIIAIATIQLSAAEFAPAITYSRSAMPRRAASSRGR